MYFQKLNEVHYPGAFTDTNQMFPYSFKPNSSLLCISIFLNRNKQCLRAFVSVLAGISVGSVSVMYACGPDIDSRVPAYSYSPCFFMTDLFHVQKY